MKFIIIDDEAEDRRLTINYLKKDFPSAEFVEILTQKQFYDEIEKGDYDVVITDYQIHWTNGIKILMEIRKRKPFTPVIMLTAAGTEEVAVEAMKRGLDDYVIKSPRHILRLPAAVKGAIEKEKAKEKEKMLSAIVENAREGVISTDKDGKIIYANRVIEEIFGWKPDDLVGKNISVFIKREEELKKAMERKWTRFKAMVKDRNGNEIPVLLTIIAFMKEDELLFSSYIFSDMREVEEYRKKIEHMNELLKIMRNIDQLIAKEKNIDALLNKICHAFSKVGRYEEIYILHDNKTYVCGKGEYERIVKDMVEKGREGIQLESDKYILILPFLENESYLCIIQPKEFNKEEINLLKEVCEDISLALHSIKIEEELRKKEELSKAILSSSPVGIGFTINGVMGWANDTMYKMTGYSPNETLGKSAKILYEDEKEYKRVSKEIKKAFMEGKIADIETKWKRKDGSIFDCYLRVCPLNPKKWEEGAIVVAVDITEKKKLEKEIKESEEKFRNLVEKAHDAIYILTSNKFEYVNPAFESLTEYSKEKLTNEEFNPIKLIHPDDIKLFKDAGKRGRCEFRIITKNGKIRIVEATSFNIGKEKIIGILRDVTERRRAEEEIRKLADLHYIIGMCINRSKTIVELCKKLLKNLKEILKIEFMSIFVCDKKEENLLFIAGYQKIL